jgi:hypothetical protein
LELQKEVDKNLVLSLKNFMSLIELESIMQAQQYVRKNLHVLLFLLNHKDSTIS